MKSSNDPFGNRTRDLSAYTAVPQPNAPLRDPILVRDLYSSPRMIKVITLKRMRWAGRVARVRGQKYACRVLVEEP